MSIETRYAFLSDRMTQFYKELQIFRPKQEKNVAW